MRHSLCCLLLGLALTAYALAQTIEQKVCNGGPGHSAVIQPDADAFIVGYFAFHGPQQGQKAGCGQIRDGEMQAYEAIRWALDRLNKKGQMLNGEFLGDHYIPGIRIGMQVRDYCSSANGDLGLDELFPQFSSSSTECQRQQDALMLGLVGMSNSDDTMMLAKQAEKLNLPLVSFEASAPVLSDTEAFPNFMRTIPPDGPLTYTIVEVAKNLNWQYVVVVFTENTYGNGAYRSIRPQLAEAGICLTSAIAVDPDDTTNATMSSIFKQIQDTETVGVIYLGNNGVIESLLNVGETYAGAGKLQWIVTDSISVSSKFPGQKYPRGLLSVVPANRKITEFEDHWVRIDVNNPSPENPWYQQMYQARNRCNLPGLSSTYTADCQLRSESQRRADFVQDQFVEPAVHAVYTYARALKNAHAALCFGTPGMCTELRELSTMDFYNNYMRSLDFVYGKAERVESLASYSLDPYNAPAAVNYDGNDLVNPSFHIYNFNDYPASVAYKFQSVGTYINQLLEIITNRLRFYDEPRDNILPYIPSSQCPIDPCGPCLGRLASDKYVYIPGDIVIQASFSLHEPGDSPFSCGEFYNGPDQGIQHMQAFIFAVEYINSFLANSKSKLPGVKLGALAFDDCYHHVRSNQFVTEVQRYGRQIRDRNGENLLDPRTIEAYVGGQGHESLAVSMADLMNTIRRPMLGISTYTAMLDNEEEYPYFMRAQYNIEYVARALVNVAKRNGWKYIQSVYNGDTFGTEANNVLRRIAAEEGICIIASFDIEMNSGESVVKMLQSRGDVQPVVTLLLYEDFRKFLHGMRMLNATELQLITISGASNRYIEGYEDYVGGMISLELWSPAFKEFKEHLEQIDASTYLTNPWMQEWYENFYDCSLNPTGTQTACPGSNMFRDLDNFELNPSVVTAIYSVIAIAWGLDETLDHYCGAGNGVCGDFMTAEDKAEVLMQKISEVIYSEDGNAYQFMAGMGNIPFTYYNYDTQNNALESVGQYKPLEDFLYLEDYELSQGRGSSGVHSSCDGVCMECLYLFRYQKILYVPGDLLIPAIFDVHGRGDSPYACAELRDVNGFQYTEAFRYALQQINTGRAPVHLNGVQLGGLGFDGCTDPIRASALVTGIYSGAIPRPETDLGMVDFDTSELTGWLSYDSGVTINVAKILQRFGVPSVTPGATSPVLDDKDMFTTLFRTIPSGSLIAEVMAKMANYLEFTYIITLNAPEDGSREAVQAFRKYAEARGICIGASYEFETDGDAKQLMEYILDSTTKVVAVFSSPDDNIQKLLAEKESIAEADDLIFLTDNPWTTPVSKTLRSPTNTISFLPEGNFDLEMFRDFLSQQLPSVNHPNPWLREFYEKFFKCNLAGNYDYDNACLDPAAQPMDMAAINPDIRIIPTINAVYALAEGIHRTLVVKCGPTYSDVCAAFNSDKDTLEIIMQQMDALNFTDVNQLLFRFIEREVDRKIVIKRFEENKNEREEGSYVNGEMTIIREIAMKNYYEDIPSSCIGQCLQCERDSMGDEEFLYINGDIHIGALFDIHKAGGTPYTCGEINGIHGFELMEAFNWALDYVNSKQGIFRRKLLGIQLGALIFDVCSSPVRAGNLVANFHARNFRLQTTDYRIDPTIIDTYVGPLTSESSIRVADVLSELGIPQISYGASSLELRDQRKYRYFLRTVPADDKQARALIAFLKKYSLDNIQLITQFSSVGEFGREEFLRLARLNHICVSAEFVVGHDGPISELEAKNAVNSLMHMANASVVIIIMDDPYPILDEANKRDDIVEHFGFLATDKWGFGITGYKNLRTLDNLITKHKVVTLDIETADFPELDSYLQDKTPDSYSRNPWFKEYYEYMHDCSLSGPTAKYPNPCPEMMMGYSRVEKYIQDPYALYVINAVFSAALGFHEALTEWCGPRYSSYCQILRELGERREVFLNHIKKVEFEDWTRQPFYFTENGESDRGFHVYEPQNLTVQNYQLSLHEQFNSPGYYWEDIGSYEDPLYLKMDATYWPNMYSKCVVDDVNYCSCEFPQYQPSRYLKKPSDQDLNIVFVSNVHYTDPANNMACGAINTGSNMQNMFAFLYALEKINSNEGNKFSGSLQLGGVVMDACSRPSRIGQDVYSLLSGEPVCGEKDGTQVVPPASVMAYMTTNSANSIALSSMLSPLQVTTVSMSATSVELNDKIEHSYFLRTVPPDNVQALVVAQILERFGWDYVQVVYSDSSYGRSAVDTLLRTINPDSPQLCFAQTVLMSVDSDLTEAKSVIDQLNTKFGARVIVTFVGESQVRQLLQATNDKGLKNRFLWVGSDTWANNDGVTAGLEEPALGAVTIQIRSEFSNDFRKFVKSITFNDRKGIPNDWFEEIYQTVHQCRILDSPIQKTYTRICTGDEVFTDDMIPNDPYVLHTIIAMYQIAHGLNDIEACRQGTLTIASCIALQKDRKDLIYRSILEAQHDVLPEDLGDDSFNFKFTADGYGDISYNIYNFQTNLATSRYEYVQIGRSAGELRLDTRQYKGYSYTDRTLPMSRCPISSTCQCVDANGDNYPFSRDNDGYIVTEEGKYMDPTTGQLVTIEDEPGTSQRFMDIWALIVVTLAAIGAFSSLCLFVYLLVVYPVRGGTTILGYMLSFGIILEYVLVYAFIVHATQEICALRRFCLGFVYCICYAALFIKLVDCWRTRTKEDIYMVKYNKIGNPWGLFFSAVLIVLVQVMINAEWLILESPGVTKVLYNNMLWSRCMPDDFYDEGLILSNLFVMFVIFISVLIGLAAFGNDKNHWDSRWLLGCVVLTIPAWMVWCLVAALGEYKMRDAAVAIGLLYNATVMLVCGPCRKLYLLNRYQATVQEEEKKSQLALSTRDYNSMYGRQYDNVPRLHDGDSVTGSPLVGDDDVFSYPKS